MKRQVKKRIISFIALIAMLLTTVLSTGDLSLVKADVANSGSGVITEIKGGEKVVLYDVADKVALTNDGTTKKGKLQAASAEEKDGKLVSTSKCAVAVFEKVGDSDVFQIKDEETGKYFTGSKKGTDLKISELNKDNTDYSYWKIVKSDSQKDAIQIASTNEIGRAHV